MGKWWCLPIIKLISNKQFGHAHGKQHSNKSLYFTHSCLFPRSLLAITACLTTRLFRHILFPEPLLRITSKTWKQVKHPSGISLVQVNLKWQVLVRTGECIRFVPVYLLWCCSCGEKSNLTQSKKIPEDIFTVTKSLNSLKNF